jgi:uncharacterized lipoprotein
MTGLRLMVLTALLVLQGCGVFKSDLDKCHELREYQAAEPGPRLRVPDGLEPLNAEARLEMPYGAVNVDATPDDQPCLIEPPSYNDRAGN